MGREKGGGGRWLRLSILFSILQLDTQSTEKAQANAGWGKRIFPLT